MLDNALTTDEPVPTEDTSDPEEYDNVKTGVNGGVSVAAILSAAVCAAFVITDKFSKARK